MNFQVTVLKILVIYPDGFAVMDDLKRDMAILATCGRDWANRTKRMAARVPNLNIFSQGLVDREAGGWKITAKGRAVLEIMEPRQAELIRPSPLKKVAAPAPVAAATPVLPLRSPVVSPSSGENAAAQRATVPERLPPSFSVHDEAMWCRSAAPKGKTVSSRANVPDLG